MKPKLSFHRFCQMGGALLVGLSFFILSYVGSVHAAAGINRQINFQGKLVKVSDSTNITDGPYNFTFKLFDSSSGGTQLPNGSPWSESQTLTVTNGIFRAAIGSSVTFPTALDFNSDSLYLDITFNGETFSSRVRMAAVPYAFTAEKVSGLSVVNNGGNTLSIATNKMFSVLNTVTLGGTDGTTFTLPTATDTLAGLAAAQTLTNKTIGAGGLSFSSASVDITTAGNEDLIISPGGTGNVGIGTTSTAAKLDVGGSLRVSTTTIFNGLTYTWPTAQSSGAFLTTNGSGVLSWSTSVSAAAAVSFSGVTSGTNTSAIMTVGAGASLTYASTGIINATQLLGSTWAAPAAIGTTTPAGATFTTVNHTTGVNTGAGGGTIRLDASGNLLNIAQTTFNGLTYTWPTAQSSGAFLTTNGSGVLSWSTSVSAAAAVSFSGVTSGTNTSAIMTVGAGASLTYASTGIINATQLLGNTWAVPAVIGATTPNGGTFSTVTTNNIQAANGTVNAFNLNDNGISLHSYLSAQYQLDDDNNDTIENYGIVTNGGQSTLLKLNQSGDSGSSARPLMGLGTAAPEHALHVNTFTKGKALAVLNELGDQNIISASASGTTVLNLDRSGNISSAGGAKWKPLTDSTSALSMADSFGTVVLSLDSTNRRIGIGSATPSQALDVTGNFKLSGSTVFNGLTYTWPTSQSASAYLITNGSGVLSWTTSITANSLAFNSLTAGTNTTAVMTVGTGASLTYSGTGVINATQLLGNTWAVPAVLGTTTPNGGTFTTVSTTTGVNTGAGGGTIRLDASGNLLNIGTTTFNGQTYTWPTTQMASGYLRTDGSGALTWVSATASSLAFNAITAGTNTTAVMTVGAGASLTYASSGIINATQLLGNTWAVPAVLGTTTPNGGTFTTVNATTGFNTGAGGGTQRIDSSGNLVNIGNITATAGLSLSTASNGTISLLPQGTGSVLVNSGVTTGNGTYTSAMVLMANSLSSGNGLFISSTSNSYSTGNLAALEWSPGGSSTTFATGDLLNLNIGANGSIGNIFNVKDNGSSVFSVSQSQITEGLPVAFTAAGDVSVAYDMVFTNPAISSIKSAAPLVISSGEVFNSSDLTLKTYNSGNLVLDVGGVVSVGTAGNIGEFYVGSAAVGKAMAIFDELGDQSIITASASGVTKFVLDHNGNVGIGTSAPAAPLHVAGTTSIFGVGEGGTPTATTIRGAAASGSNVSGATLTFDASNGTGTGGSGSISFRTAPNGLSQPLFDKATTANTAAGASTTTLAWTHTVGTSGTANKSILLVGVAFQNFSGQTVSTVTFAGTALTFSTAITNTTTVRQEMWYYMNPPTTTGATVSVTVSAGTRIVGSSMSFYNVDQTTPFGTITTTNGSGTTATTSVSSASTELVVSLLAKTNSTDAVTTFFPIQMTNGATTHATAATNVIGVTAYSPGDTTEGASFTWATNSRAWASIGVPLKPVSVSATTADTLAEMLNIGQTAVTVKGLLNVGPVLRFSRTTIASTATDTAKDVECTTDFGSNYQAAGGYDVGAYAGAGGSGNFNIQGFTTAVKIAISNGATNGSAPALANVGSSSTVQMACVRKDAPFRQSRTKISSIVADGLKDGVCTGDFGSNYQAAGLNDITTNARAGASAAGNINAAGVVVAWNTAVGTTGTVGEVSGGSASVVPVACIRTGSQTGADLAEYIPTSDTVGVGDIVSTDPKNDVMAMRSTTAYDHAVLGVIATQPGLVLGSQDNQSDGVLALSGRVPAKVMTTDPSQIKTGDYITTSGLKGVGMKLMQTGPTVGKALQTSADWSQEKCPVADSYDAIVWPVSDGKNLDKSCFRIPTSSLPSSMQSKTTSPYVYVGKLMVLVNLSWADPKVAIAQAQESASTTQSSYALSDRDVAALFISTRDENGVVFEHTNGSSTDAIASASATLMGTTSLSSIDLTALIDNQINKSSIGGLEVMRSTIDRLNDRVASLEGVLSVGRVSSESAFVSNILGAATSASPSSGLVAGDLHVGGSALVEGVLNVIDNITAPNMVIGRWADFMGSAIFRGPIHFFGRPTVSSDTAGIAVIQKGQDSVTIVFKKEYDKSPVITANLAVQGKDVQTATESAALDADLRLVVTNVTAQGFTVKLSKKASQDMPVSWMAITVQDDSVAMGRE